jgi:hypothetical protein
MHAQRGIVRERQAGRRPRHPGGEQRLGAAIGEDGVGDHQVLRDEGREGHREGEPGGIAQELREDGIALEAIDGRGEHNGGEHEGDARDGPRTELRLEDRGVDRRDPRELPVDAGGEDRPEHAGEDHEGDAALHAGFVAEVVVVGLFGRDGGADGREEE